jgi:hypothetical protein
LSLLESRATTNRLSEETKDEIMDMVQECRRYVYQRYREEAIRFVPAAANPTARLSPEPTPPLPSNTSSSDNDNGNSNDGNATQQTPSKEDVLDLFDFDPVEFQGIFENNMLDSDFFTFDNMDPKQTKCYCIGLCTCPH